MEKLKLELLEKDVLNIMVTKIKNIIQNARKNIIVLKEKDDGDSVTTADIEIGEYLSEFLENLLPGSLIIEEESFNEEKYKLLFTSKYVWVIDPIDGTKAFRDINNHEWCVGVCLLENMKPIFSCVYIPENWKGQSYLLSANDFDKYLKNFDKKISPLNSNKNFYVSHIHTDNKRNEFENKIASKIPENSTIRAYAGHSTLVQIAEVALDSSKVFSRRSANLWDIVQSAYLVSVAGAEVRYNNGENIFPVALDKLQFKNNHLLMPDIVAASKDNINLIFN